MPLATARLKAVLNEVMQVLEDETNDDTKKIGFLIVGGIILAHLREVERLLPNNKNNRKLKYINIYTRWHRQQLKRKPL